MSDEDLVSLVRVSGQVDSIFFFSSILLEFWLEPDASGWQLNPLNQLKLKREEATMSDPNKNV